MGAGKSRAPEAARTRRLPPPQPPQTGNDAFGPLSVPAPSPRNNGEHRLHRRHRARVAAKRDARLGDGRRQRAAELGEGEHDAVWGAGISGRWQEFGEAGGLPLEGGRPARLLLSHKSCGHRRQRGEARAPSRRPPPRRRAPAAPSTSKCAPSRVASRSPSSADRVAASVSAGGVCNTGGRDRQRQHVAGAVSGFSVPPAMPRAQQAAPQLPRRRPGTLTRSPSATPTHPRSRGPRPSRALRGPRSGGTCRRQRRGRLAVGRWGREEERGRWEASKAWHAGGSGWGRGWGADERGVSRA
jgi:hypothetical protein